MARLGLTLFLILLTAVGPSLCCCAIAVPSARADATKPETPPVQRGEPKPSCPCCHDSPTEADRPVAPAPAQPCPCHEQRPESATPAIADASLTTQLTRLLALPDFAGNATVSCTPFFGAQDAPGATFAECFSLPLQDPREILRALHVLLC
jgi:hypothetical protein